MDWCTFFTLKSLHLYTITGNTAKFCWNIHTNLMLSKIGLVINCLSILCQLVMPRSLKCCSLSTITGLLVEQSDKCWGRHFARGLWIISLVFMKFIFILFGVAQDWNCWRNVWMWVCCEPRSRSSVKVVSSTYLRVRQSTVTQPCWWYRPPDVQHSVTLASQWLRHVRGTACHHLPGMHSRWRRSIASWRLYFSGRRLTMTRRSWLYCTV